MAAIGILLPAGGAVARLGAQSSLPARSVWDGVYTDLQASRGERDYARTCARCHGLSLEGDTGAEVPALDADAFMRRWSGRSAKNVFDVLMRSMPADAPGSLTPQRSAELLAYLLRANDLPAGETPLPSAPDGLAAIAIARSPEAAR